MSKQVAPRKQQVNLSEYSNISAKANASTQTVSNKKLIKAVLHSVGLTHSKSEPVANNSHNSKQFDKLLAKTGQSKLGYQLQHSFMANVSKQTVL